jgi:hypothetical protein
MQFFKWVGIGFAIFMVATLAADAATQHDNDVYFALAGVQSFSFNPTGYSVTKGQPYGGAFGTVSQQGKQGEIIVKAGRKKSKAVAQWFQQQVGSGQTLVCDSTGTFPDELNFAVQGTLTMQVNGKTITCDNIIVAQGNFTTVNNWWMGSPYMSGAHIGPSGATIQSCRVQGGLPTAVIFSPATPCVNHFNIGFLLGP